MLVFATPMAAARRRTYTHHNHFTALTRNSEFVNRNSQLASCYCLQSDDGDLYLAFMTERIESFTKLDAWQVAHRLVIDVYNACDHLDKFDTLRSQMERAVVSVTSNIAEGFGRQSLADKRHFYVMARGSAYELQNQLLIARDTNKINAQTFQTLAEESTRSLMLLHGLIRSLANK